MVATPESSTTEPRHVRRWQRFPVGAQEGERDLPVEPDVLVTRLGRAGRLAFRDPRVRVVLEGH
jgi:hypothetical protein